MTTSSEPRIELVGPIYNFAEKPDATPAELAQEAGLTFVAMDARAYAAFRGGASTGEWVVSRRFQGNFPQLQNWPKTGWRFQDEAKARDAYQQMRAHIMANLEGVQAQEDRSEDRKLLDPEHALGEAFIYEGEEALYLCCDRTSEAKILEMMTNRLEAFTTQGATPLRYASYSSQIAPHLIGVAATDGGLAEHLVAVFTPGDEQDLISAGLVKSVREADLKPFQLEIPSGVLIVAWGRIDGASYFAKSPEKDPAEVITEILGENGGAPLPTPLDEVAPGPLAWAFRVRPGTYACALRWLETEQGISAMALSHLEAAPLWADQIPKVAKKTAAPVAPPVIAAPTAATIAQAQAAQASVAAGGGDADPECFPGQPVAKLSDYVKLMKGMQRGDMMGALKAAGLDMMGYGKVAQQWGMKMATDPAITAKFTAMMAKA